ncbi:hypothetical protein MBLNU230_g6183t1 [Neophaeotheca triangularis]
MPGVPVDAFSQLEKVFKGHKLDQLELSDASTRQWRKRRSQNIATTFAHIPDSDSDHAPGEEEEVDDDDGSDVDMHEGFGRLATPSRQPLASLKSQASGLPPTPPTTNGSDSIQKQPQQTSPPVFADGLRNALHASKSGLKTPEQHQTPLTPDPSPPSNRNRLNPPRPTLQHIGSSRAESFMTAKESLGGNTSTPALGRFGSYDGGATPSLANEENEEIDWDRHVSYVSHDMEELTWDAIPEEEEVAPLRYTPRKVQNSEQNGGTTAVQGASDGHSQSITGIAAGLEGSAVVAGDAEVPSQDPAPGPGNNGNLRRNDNAVDGPQRLLSVDGFSIDTRESTHANDAPATHYPATPPGSGSQNASYHADMFSFPTADRSSSASPSPPQRSQPRTLYRPQAQTPPPTVPKTKPDGEWTPTRNLRYTSNHRQDGDNDAVYRQIQEAKSDRYDALQSTNSVEAHVIPTPPSTQRSLRHMGKIPTLRQHVGAVESPFLPSARGRAEKSYPQDFKVKTPLRPALPTSRTLFPQNDSQRTSLTFASLDGHHGEKAAQDPRRSSGWQRGEVDRDLETPSPVLARHHPLRHYQKDNRLENNDFVKLTSIKQATYQSNHGRSPTPSPQPSHGLRRTSAEHRLENSLDLPRMSLDRPEKTHTRTSSSQLPKSPTSPRHMELGNPRLLLAMHTPASTSQVSAATEGGTEMEVCEAKGISLFPHNNESLLVVQHGSKRGKKSRSPPAQNYLGIPDKDLRSSPVFAAVVEPATPPMGADKETEIEIDSPLQNPRAAPAPPVIKFIPPTPGDELDRELTMDDATAPKRPSPPQRRLSLLQKARRYSDTHVQPLFGRSVITRSRPSSEATQQRNNYLSPLWRPQRFWDDADSESDNDDGNYDETLPQGGDTSEIVEESNRNRSWFPRSMSVRMPGFRGTGGFMVGNSLGIDRHGTNNRRHYVSMPAALIQRRSKASAENVQTSLMRTQSASNNLSNPSLRRKASEEMLRSMSSQRSLGGGNRRYFVVPLTKGMRVEYVGFAAFGKRVKALRRARESKAREKRKEELKRSIGTRTYHDNGVSNGN